MSRPIYEVEQDRENARMAIALVCEVFDLRVAREVPYLDGVDFVLRYPDGEEVVLAEVKCRNGIYPDLMIAWKKVQRLIESALLVSLNPMLGIYWWDSKELWTCNPSVVPHRHAMGGRRDRNDPLDIEHVVHIDRGKFSVFSF